MAPRKKPVNTDNNGEPLAVDTSNGTLPDGVSPLAPVTHQDLAHIYGLTPKKKTKEG